VGGDLVTVRIVDIERTLTRPNRLLSHSRKVRSLHVSASNLDSLKRKKEDEEMMDSLRIEDDFDSLITKPIVRYLSEQFHTLSKVHFTGLYETKCVYESE
jgi:hypothetical protein